MTGILDDAEIALPCKICGRKTQKSVGWIKNNKEFVCACGTRITLDTDEFIRDIGRIDFSAGKIRVEYE